MFTIISLSITGQRLQALKHQIPQMAKRHTYWSKRSLPALTSEARQQFWRRMMTHFKQNKEQGLPAKKESMTAGRAHISRNTPLRIRKIKQQHIHENVSKVINRKQINMDTIRQH